LSEFSDRLAIVPTCHGAPAGGGFFYCHRINDFVTCFSNKDGSKFAYYVGAKRIDMDDRTISYYDSKAADQVQKYEQADMSEVYSH